MAIFDSRTVVWRGTEYVIPATRIMGAIATIEEVITLVELSTSMKEGKPPLHKIAKAYAGVLRYAGAKATDEEVYAGMFANGLNPDQILAATYGLMELMIPKQPLPAAPGVASQGNALPGA